MRVFAYVGSARGRESYSRMVVEKLIQKLKESGLVDSEFIASPDKYEIKNCRGCTRCYYSGKCPLDDCDSMGELKREMEKADLIILASPVYIHNVTGYMKNFLDRLTMWCYTMPMIGKYAFPISVSATNGNSYVDGYLNKILNIFGAGMIGNMSICTVFMKENDLSDKIGEAVENIAGVVEGKKKLESNKGQVDYYLRMKKLLTNLDDENHIKKYWEDNNRFNSDSEFAKYIERRK